MNPFHTGFKEFHRRLRRQKNRLALGHARGALGKAEIALGRACWRRLENVDTPGAREAISALRGLDQELDAHTKHIAELEEKVKVHEAERDTARQEAQTVLAKVEEERRPIAQQEKEAQTRLAEQQNALREHDRKVAELDTEQLALLREHAQIHVDAGVQGDDAPVDSTRARDMRRREISGRRVALPQQLAQLKAGREAISAPLTELDAALREVRTRVGTLDGRAKEARAALATKEKAATAAVAALHRELAATRRQIARTEEEKDEPFRFAGRELASRDERPEGEALRELFEEALRQRQAVHSLEELDTTWTRESKEADRQDLRIFGFIGVTCCVLLALSLLLFFRSPSPRDTLPENTEAIVSVNVNRFTSGDLARALQQPGSEENVWQQLWSGLVRKVSEVPGLNLDEQVARITRAVVPGNGDDYLLVEMRPNVNMDRLVPALRLAGGFGEGKVDGLVLNSKPDLAFTQLGPRTLAVGTVSAVVQLIHVRVGIQPDMKVDAEFLNNFQRLDPDSALRVMTLRPDKLRALADPILSYDLLERCQLVGLAVDLQPGQPATAHFLIRASSTQNATLIAGILRRSPEAALQLQAAGPNLFMEPPALNQSGQGVDWRFRMTSPAAREFLQRVSRLGLTGGERTAAVKGIDE